MYPHLFNLLDLTCHQFKTLTETFPDLKTAWEKSAEPDFLKSGVTPERIEKLINTKKQINLAQEEKKLKKLKTLTLNDQNYPQLLKEIYDPPIILYYHGQIKPEDSFSLSVVGARYHSFYGEKVIHEIIPPLVHQNFTIVSGLAIGIDTLAHQETLKNRGRTLAVLGSGLDVIYPPRNQKLYQQIQAQGAVISEFPPGTGPDHHNFPRRNRIISGLSLGTLVIEARERSGSLITARFALEQSREVFAVPGSIHNSVSQGTNKLIQAGSAYPVSSANDLLEKLKLDPLTQQVKPQPQFETKTEAKIYQILTENPLNRDDLTQKLKLDPAAINTIISTMELKGLIKNDAGVLYVT